MCRPLACSWDANITSTSRSRLRAHRRLWRLRPAVRPASSPSRSDTMQSATSRRDNRPKRTELPTASRRVRRRGLASQPLRFMKAQSLSEAAPARGRTGAQAVPRLGRWASRSALATGRPKPACAGVSRLVDHDVFAPVVGRLRELCLDGPARAIEILMGRKSRGPRAIPVSALRAGQGFCGVPSSSSSARVPALGRCSTVVSTFTSHVLGRCRATRLEGATDADARSRSSASRSRLRASSRLTGASRLCRVALRSRAIAASRIRAA